MEEILDNVPRTRVRPSPIHGRGLFTEVDVAEGQLLGVLDGQAVDPTVRPEVLFGEEWNALAEDRLLVRPIRTKYGFINHAPDPNCELVDEGRVIRALRDVPAGTELTLDYTAQPLPPAYLADPRADFLRGDEA